MMLGHSVTTDARLVDLSRAMPKVAARALNRTGAKAVTLMVRELTAQTGLPRKTLKRAVEAQRAGEKQLAFVLKTRGGNINLRFFKARETRQGVSAAPLGKRVIIPHTFMKAGRFPNRVPFTSRSKGMNGNVFVRVGKGACRSRVDVPASTSRPRCCRGERSRPSTG